MRSFGVQPLRGKTVAPRRRGQLPELPAAPGPARTAERGTKVGNAAGGMHQKLWAIVVALVAIVACQGPPPVNRGAVASYVEVLAPARRSGPVADYEAVIGGTIHREVEDMAPELRPALQRWLGGRLVVTGYTAPSRDPDEGAGSDLSLLWMRDYQPIHIRDEQGRLTVVHYLSENPNRSVFRPPGPGRDRPGKTWMPTPSGGRWLPSRVMPLIHENGNLLSLGGRVIVSDKIIDDNAEPLDEPHLLAHGYRPRRRDEVIRLLAHSLDRAVSDIIVVPKMPYESTGHVDVFLLPLDDQTVMVPSIEDRALRRVDRRPPQVGKVVQVFLDEQARFLESLGLSVPRWPMVPPALAFPGDEHEADHEQDGEAAAGEPAERYGEVEFELLLFSPANALLLDVAGRGEERPVRLALLPGFVGAFTDPAMAALAASYTRTWEREIGRRAFTSQVVDASELVGYLGLFHCVSAPIPR